MQKFKAGKTAHAERRFKDAVDLFLQADSIISNPVFAYNVGVAYDDMSDYENALRWLREYLRRDPDASNLSAVEERIDVHERHLRGKGVQQVTVLSTPAEATLWIDDKVVGATPWTGELPPGHHVARVELAGYTPTDKAFELGAARAIDVDLSLAPASADLPATDDTMVPAGDMPAADASATSPLAYVGFGVGAAGLVVGAISGVLAIDAASAAREGCDADNICPTENEEDADRATTFAHVSTIGFVAAGAGAAVGLVALFVLGDDVDDDDVAVRVLIGPGSVGLGGAF